MKQEVLEIVQKMDLKAIETQLALQCAPMITSLKISNLLIIQNTNLYYIKQILKNTDISYYVLLQTEQKTILLLYDKNKLESYLSKKRVKNLLKEMGYEKLSFYDVLCVFQLRYQGYMKCNKEFPHEMGLLLGYPVEDVEGFIHNKGKNFLYTGYWKVYENLPDKLQMFHKFELAKEALIRLISNGANIADIIDTYRQSRLQKAAV